MGTYLYRLVKARHWRGSLVPSISQKARWHSGNRKVVYLAETPATALLEWIKGQFSSKLLPQEIAASQLLLIEFQCALDEVHIFTPDTSTLPNGWWRIPNSHSLATQAIGNAWLDAQKYLAMRVPSAALPATLKSRATSNLLLNPNHSAFAGLAAQESYIGHHFDLAHYLGL